MPNVKSVPSSFPPRSAGLGRRAVLQTLMAGAGAAVGVPALAHEHPLHESLQDPAEGRCRRTACPCGRLQAGVPRSASVRHARSCCPRRSCPARRNAKVAEFIDALLAVERPRTQRQLLDRARRVRGTRARRASQGMEGADTSRAERAADQGLDRRAAASAVPKAPDGGTRTIRDHFDHLKGWISGAYYSVGGRDERTWMEGRRHPSEAPRLRAGRLERVSAAGHPRIPNPSSARALRRSGTPIDLTGLN